MVRVHLPCVFCAEDSYYFSLSNKTQKEPTRWPTTKLPLSLLTTDLECARPVLPVTTHHVLYSLQSSADHDIRLLIISFSCCFLNSFSFHKSVTCSTLLNSEDLCIIGKEDIFNLNYFFLLVCECVVIDNRFWWIHIIYIIFNHSSLTWNIRMKST